MGFLRRLIDDILNIPLNEMRLRLFTEVLREAPIEAVLLTIAVLGLLMVGVFIGLWKGWARLANRYPVPVLKLVGLLVGSLLALDALIDFLAPAIHEVLRRTTG